jgi:nitroreductase
MWTRFKRAIAGYLPNSFFRLYNEYLVERELKETFKYDYKRYKEHSASKGFNNQIKLEGILVRGYHVIEKGLTMPETRLGFGQSKIIDLCNYCQQYILNYNYRSSKQLEHALIVLKEYLEFHENRKFELPPSITSKINYVLHLANLNTNVFEEQTIVSKKEYFKYTNDSFPLFSNSRKSVRNYIDVEIPEKSFKEALSLALNAPSACNRQSSHMHIFSDPDKIKKILELQGGANGFGHLATKLIVITAELGVFNSPRERNQAFIDGGIFSMNLLYSLHAHSIAGCILNCNFPPLKDVCVREECGIQDHEVFIAMISCGIPPDKFKLANSLRYCLEDRCKFY